MFVLSDYSYRTRCTCYVGENEPRLQTQNKLSVRWSIRQSGLGSGDNWHPWSVERYCKTSTCTESCRPRSAV